MKHYLLFSILAIMLYFSSSTQAQNNPPQVNYTCFYMDSLQTWAYDISVNGKIFIHQEFIPAVSGLQKFTTKAKSEKVAQLVADKIRQGKEFPTVTITELQQLGVISNE